MNTEPVSAAEWAKSVAETITNNPPDDTEAADVIADLHAAEKILAGVRRSLTAELPGPVAGRHYRVVERRTARRSYNTDGILAKVGGVSALPSLIDADVVRLSWQWSKLRSWFTLHDLELTVAGHEIDDGDPDALVGEVWETKLAIEPKRPA